MQKIIKLLSVMLFAVILFSMSCINSFAADEVKNASEVSIEMQKLKDDVVKLCEETKLSKDSPEYEEIEREIDGLQGQVYWFNSSINRYIYDMNEIFQNDPSISSTQKNKLAIMSSSDNSWDSIKELEKYAREFIDERNSLISFHDEDPDNASSLKDYVKEWKETVPEMEKLLQEKHETVNCIFKRIEDTRTKIQEIIDSIQPDDEPVEPGLDTVQVLNKTIALPEYKRCDQPNGSLVVPKDAVITDSTGERFFTLDGSNEMQTVSTSELFFKEPTITDIVQQDVGDCYFLTALGSLVESNPDLIKNNIIYNPEDRTAIIRFFDDKGNPYYYKIDASIPKNHTQTGALWPKLFEKAYILHRELVKKVEKPSSVSSFHYYSSIEGGFPSRAAADLTPNTVAHVYTVEKLKKSKRLTISERIQPHLDKKNLVFCGFYLSTEEKVRLSKKNLYGDHSYAIIGIERNVRTTSGTMDYVILRNPHGSHVPQYIRDHHGVPQLIASPDSRLGQFKLKLDDFTAIFQYIEISQFF